MLFHMVWFILFGVLGQETTFSLVEVLQQPIRNFQLKVFRANTRNKMDHIKSMKNCAQKLCRSLCAFLFEATCTFGKMCRVETKKGTASGKIEKLALPTSGLFKLFSNFSRGLCPNIFRHNAQMIRRTLKYWFDSIYRRRQWYSLATFVDPSKYLPESRYKGSLFSHGNGCQRQLHLFSPSTWTCF